MAHLLKDCESLLKQAWKEIRIKEDLNRDTEIKLNELLAEIECQLTYNEKDAFDVLKQLLIQKLSRYKIYMTTWKSCQQLYESLLLLLNSDYKKYDIIDIGNAQTYFKDAIPLYCKLSGDKPPVLKTQKSSLQEQLKSGDILLNIKRDIPGVQVIRDKELYKKFLTGTGYMMTIAYKDKYNVQIALNGLGTQGIRIEGTNYKLRVINAEKNRELKVSNYSDIKRILSRV